MESETLYAIGGVVVFLITAIFVMRTGEPTVIQTKEEKREEILQQYAKELTDSLCLLKDDKEARVAKKTQLLKRFSKELSLNIFFDKIEIKEIILDLAEVH